MPVPILNTMAASTTPLLPALLVVPLACALMMAIAAHVLVLPKSDMPASRRRLRTTNGLVMMFVTALMGYALCVVTTSQPQVFVIVWTSIVFLLGVVVCLALLDVMNTWRIAAAARRRLRQELAQRMPGAKAGRTGGDGAP
ncbi:MAG: hypothetical protein KF745_04735 [Phycisphaeraceae bacterium]|nr:hypothetical protein [Phycisphaeraceae bacterium]